jgi:hypothetical protein
MSVLSEYCETLGQIITRYAATLTSFSGGGLMVLVSALIQARSLRSRPWIWRS